jgi:hypothetical protein
MKTWMKLLIIMSAINMPILSQANFEDSYYEEDSYNNDRVERSYEDESGADRSEEFEQGPSQWERSEIQKQRRNAYRPTRLKQEKHIVSHDVLGNEKSSVKKTNLYTSPAHLAFGSYQLGVDFKLTQKSSWGLNTSFLNSRFEESLSGHEIDLLGQSVGLRYNLFFNGPAFSDSFLLQAEVGAMRVDFTDITSVNNGHVSGIAKQTALYGNLGVGYGWFWKKLNVQILGGAQFISKDLANGTKRWFLPGKGISPWVGLNLGISI